MPNDITIFTKHLPPSVNACFSNVKGKGRIRTERYRQWATAAGWDFNGKGKIDGPFSVSITIDRSRRHPLADVDNFIKPTVDLLQTHGIVTNDRMSESVSIRWGDADGGMIVHVMAHSQRAA